MKAWGREELNLNYFVPLLINSIILEKLSILLWLLISYLKKSHYLGRVLGVKLRVPHPKAKYSTTELYSRKICIFSVHFLKNTYIVKYKLMFVFESLFYAMLKKFRGLSQWLFANLAGISGQEYKAGLLLWHFCTDITKTGWCSGSPVTPGDIWNVQGTRWSWKSKQNQIQERHVP